MKKILIIEDKSKFITFRNRKVRTPVTFTINESELKVLQTHMKMADIQKWRVEAITENDNEIIDYDYDYCKQEVVIEELEEETKTILEKLIENEDE